MVSPVLSLMSLPLATESDPHSMGSPTLKRLHSLSWRYITFLALCTLTILLLLDPWSSLTTVVSSDRLTVSNLSPLFPVLPRLPPSPSPYSVLSPLRQVGARSPSGQIINPVIPVPKRRMPVNLLAFERLSEEMVREEEEEQMARKVALRDRVVKTRRERTIYLERE